MAIVYDPNKKIFTLHTRHTSYQMMVDRYGYLLHLYYGAKNSGAMDYLPVYMDRSFSGNPAVTGRDRTYSLDVLPQEYPTLGTGDYRKYALNIEDEEGVQGCNLTFSSYAIKKGKYALKGLPAVQAGEDEAQTLEITLSDAGSGLEVCLLYGVLPDNDIITRSARIKNTGGESLVLRKAAAACLDFVSGDFDVLRLYGRHAMERNVERSALGHGTLSFGSRRGASSHQYNPGIVLADPNTTEDYGSCYGMLFVYSGNFLCEAERDQFNQTRLLMGLAGDLFAYPLKSGEEFEVPEVIMTYSGRGLATLSRRYHSCILNHLCRGKYVHAPRPVLLNSWEAAYFNFDGQAIVNLAKDAARLGIDMVVMDDGWFGRRNDDNSSLGDWYVNEEKLGCTLSELIEEVNQLGVRFGIWVEPEMVNEDSNLFREHPDWALRTKKRNPVRSRNQLLLDFSRRDVRDYVFDELCSVLDQGKIDYLKWDMNRSMEDVYAGNVTYDYVLGVYDFLERLMARYPELLIEGCCGGGGRFDAGMMYYTPQIWCSDNTDAVNRALIQYGSSLFYPVSVVGSHVSAVPNEQTGRITSLKTRGIAAMAGTFGYEMNPSLLNEEEQEEIKKQVQIYKKHERLIREGEFYRLADPAKDPCAAWMQIAKDKKEALVSAIRLRLEANMPTTYLKLKGLDRQAVYLEEESGQLYFGSSLMNAGLPLPYPRSEYEAYQLHFIQMTTARELYKKLRELPELQSFSEESSADRTKQADPFDQAEQVNQREQADRADQIEREDPSLLGRADIFSQENEDSLSGRTDGNPWKQKEDDPAKGTGKDSSDKTAGTKIVLSIFGGSGSGKTTVAAILQQYFLKDGIGCFVLTGDDYPRRIPMRNDEERERIFQSEGEAGLDRYLGSPKEINFDRINAVIQHFKAGEDSVKLRKMGRQDGEIWEEEADFRDIQILLIEWTHGGSEYLKGVDRSIYLDSRPEETLERRLKRNRDENAGSELIRVTLELEQQKLVRQAKKAGIFVDRKGGLHEQ